MLTHPTLEKLKALRLDAFATRAAELERNIAITHARR